MSGTAPQPSQPFHRVEKVGATRAPTARPFVHYYRVRPVRYVVIVWRIGAQIPADPPQGTIGGGPSRARALIVHSETFPVSALARSPLNASIARFMRRPDKPALFVAVGEHAVDHLRRFDQRVWAMSLDDQVSRSINDSARMVRLDTGSDGDFEEPLTNNRPVHTLTTFSYKANLGHKIWPQKDSRFTIKDL